MRQFTPWPLSTASCLYLCGCTSAEGLRRTGQRYRFSAHKTRLDTGVSLAVKMFTPLQILLKYSNPDAADAATFFHHVERTLLFFGSLALSERGSSAR